MARARQRAHALGHEYIGTEHIFLGLLDMDDPVVKEALRAVGADVNDLARRVVSVVTTGASQSLPGQLPFTPRAKRVLELSIEEAERLDDPARPEHGPFGPEHVLLGLLAEGEGIAAVTLGAVCTLEQLRAAVAAAVENQKEPEPEPDD